MVNKNLLIGKLAPFTGKKEVLVNNQDTIDIIDALISNHYKYRSEYDKIYQYFIGEDLEETARNVFDFLKKEFKYKIESEDLQILRSPSAVLGSDRYGIDCKGYATFANGILDAYRRNTGENFDVYYRFASYDPFDKTPQHTFAVVKENGKEYWIDPVLDSFNQKKQPYYFKDKKIKNMALVALSGINKKVGDIAVDLNGNYYDTNTGEYVGTPPISSGGSTGTSWWESILKVIPAVAPVLTQKQPVYGQFPTTGAGYSQYPTGQTQSSGINTNTILILGIAGLGAYFLLKKK